MVPQCCAGLPPGQEKGAGIRGNETHPRTAPGNFDQVDQQHFRQNGKEQSGRCPKDRVPPGMAAQPDHENACGATAQESYEKQHGLGPVQIQGGHDAGHQRAEYGEQTAAQDLQNKGAGSSKIHPTKLSSLCEALDRRGVNYTYAAGYEAESAVPDETLIQEAVQAAKNADVVFACVGLPDSFESEGFDRTGLEMPEAQNVLMEALAATGTPVAAVVSTGGAIVLPWRDKVDSILLLYLTGQNGGEAAADLLFGDANPCGKLAETWPLSLEDCPCGAHFGHGGNVEYRESIYVGYRYYDKANKDVQYPFGHGLSYTEFSYSDLHVAAEGETASAIFTLTNTGSCAGAEAVQLYVAPPESVLFKPVRELRAYEKVFLKPGESRQVRFDLDRRAFAYYNVNVSDWLVESGEYRIEIGASSRDLRLSASVLIQSSQSGEIPDYRTSAPAYYAPEKGFRVSEAQFEAVYGQPVAPWRPVRPYTRNTTLTELQTSPIGKALVEQIRQSIGAMFAGGDMEAMFLAMLEDMPLRQLAMMDPVHFGGSALDALLAQLNAQP